MSCSSRSISLVGLGVPVVGHRLTFRRQLVTLDRATLLVGQFRPAILVRVDDRYRMDA